MDSGEATLINVQRFWNRRISGQCFEDETTADELLENELLFPPAVVEEEDRAIRKSRSSSPSFCPSTSRLDYSHDDFWECEGTSSKDSDLIKLNQIPGSETTRSIPGVQHLNGSQVGDIPCLYTIPVCESHEMTAAGVYIDPRILPGFTYKIRPLSFKRNTKWLFGGKSREVESVGRGYSRRITLKPLIGRVNKNQDYFWTDSNPEGFAFSLQVIEPQDKFTLFDADHRPVGHLEITQLKGAQNEVSQSVGNNGRVEKVVKVKALCKVDWFHDQENNTIVPFSGVCLSVRETRGRHKVVHIREVKLGPHQGYSLTPGTCSSLRSIRLSGADISDVPTNYTIVGIETHHLPVIGTYVDERIVPGFHYRVQLGGCGRKLFGGQALRLDSLGRGYAKRITFASEVYNNPLHHFWSDSHPEGFGFEISAVRPGMKFIIKAEDTGSVLGQAHVFRDDCAPQQELQNLKGEEVNGNGIWKQVQIDVKCMVSLDLATKEDLEPHIMRVSGIALLFKPSKQAEARVVKIIDIGLDSQLNILFFNQWQEIVFYPEELTQ